VTLKSKIQELSKKNDIDGAVIDEIIEICEANFYDDSSTQAKRTSQISKVINTVSKESFDNQ
jgi:hypothetical protein